MATQQTEYHKGNMVSAPHDFCKIALSSGKEVEGTQCDGVLKVAYYTPISNEEALEIKTDLNYRSVEFPKLHFGKRDGKV